MVGQGDESAEVGVENVGVVDQEIIDHIGGGSVSWQGAQQVI